MQRDRIDTVTHLPILIPASRGKEEGFAVVRGKLLPVRTLHRDDLKDARHALKAHEAKHFYAVTMLGRALGASPDRLAVTNAAGLLSEAYALEIKSAEAAGDRFPPFPEPERPEEERMNFARALTELNAIPPEQSVKALFSKKSGLRARGDSRVLLSHEATKAVENARLVLWWNGQEFKAAVGCSDLKTAFYVSVLFDMLKVCPRCGEPFFPDRPDQDYCSVAHREAHRVARWRSRQKQPATGTGNKRGPRKTR